MRSRKAECLSQAGPWNVVPRRRLAVPVKISSNIDTLRSPHQNRVYHFFVLPVLSQAGWRRGCPCLVGLSPVPDAQPSTGLFRGPPVVCPTRRTHVTQLSRSLDRLEHKRLQDLLGLFGIAQSPLQKTEKLTLGFGNGRG